MTLKIIITAWAYLFAVIVSVHCVLALDVQLQLQLTKFGGEEVVNDAKLSIAAASFLAIKHFNNRTGHIIALSDKCDKNTQLDVEIIDTQSDEKVALRALLTKTTATKPDIIVGPYTSSESVPLALAASVQNVPIISYGATSQRLDDSERYSTFLRTIPSDKTVADAVCSFFEYLGYKYISVLYADDEYGSAYKDAVSSSCQSFDIHAVAVAFQVGNDASVTDSVNTLRSFERNVVVAIAYESDIAVAILRAFEIGMIGTGNLWVFTDTADSVILQNVVVNEPKLAAALHGNFRVHAAGAVPGYGRFDAFNEQWKGIGVDTIRTSGMDDFAFINDKLGEVSFPPLTPSFFQGPNSSIHHAAAYAYDAIFAAGIAACEAGSDVELDLLDALRNQEPSVEGVSGRIEFSENGSRSPQSAYFAVENMIMKDTVLSFPIIGSLDSEGQFNTIEGLTTSYAGAVTTAPLDRAIIVPEFNYVSNIVIGAAWAMESILLLLIVSMLLWVFAHWNSRVVKHSQCLFLVTLLVGTLLSSATIVPLLTDDQHNSPEIASVGCMAAPWLYSLGFVLTFAALFVKTYRVSLIFNNTTLTVIRVQTRDLFAMVALLIALDGSLLGVWQGISPLTWEREVIQVDSFNRTIESFGKCTDNVSMDGGVRSIAFVSLIAVLHVCLLIVGNVYAYKARNIPTTFQESRWIGLAMASMLQLFLMGVPVVIAVADDPTARTLVMISVIFLNNFVLIAAIFFPKIYMYYYLRDGEDKGARGSQRDESNRGTVHMGRTESEMEQFSNKAPLYSESDQIAAQATLKKPELRTAIA